MSAMSDYLENKLIDHILRDQTWTKPSTIYVALFTAAPNDAGGGTEVSGGSYARVQVGPSLTAWEQTQGGTGAASSGTGGLTQNAAEITFPTPSANWGSITHFGIFDASSGGNLLFHGALTDAKTVNNGDPAPKFVAGALDITLA